MKRRKIRSRKKPGLRKKPAQQVYPAQEAAVAKEPQAQLAVPDREQLKALSERLDHRQLQAGDYPMLRATFESYVQLCELIRQEGMTAERLQELMRSESANPTEAAPDAGPNPQIPRNDNRSNDEDA